MKGAGERHLLPSWSPASWSPGSQLGGTRSHPQRRATMKALPSTPHRPRPYGSSSLLPDFPTEVDAYEGRSIGGGRDKSSSGGWMILFICIMTSIVGSRGNSNVFLDAYTFLLYDD